MFSIGIVSLLLQGLAAATSPSATLDATTGGVPDDAVGSRQRVRSRKLALPTLTYSETNCIPATSHPCIYLVEGEEWLTPPDSGALDFFRLEFSPNSQHSNGSKPSGHFELTYNSTGHNFTLVEGSPPTAPPATVGLQNSGTVGFIPSLFKPSPELPYPGKPTGNVDLTYNTSGLHITQVDSRPISTIISSVVVEETKPPKLEFKPSPQIPYPGIPTGHFDLTYNTNGLHFTQVDGRPVTTAASSEAVEGMKPPKFMQPPTLPYPGVPTGHIDLTYNSSGVHFSIEDSRPATEHENTLEPTTSTSKTMSVEVSTEGNLPSTTTSSSSVLQTKPSASSQGNNSLEGEHTSTSHLSPETPAAVVGLFTNSSVISPLEEE